MRAMNRLMLARAIPGRVLGAKRSPSPALLVLNKGHRGFDPAQASSPSFTGFGPRGGPDTDRDRVDEVAVSPDGRLAVVTNSIVPDGSRAYIRMTGEDKVAVVDLGKLEVVSELKTSDGPDGIAWVERP